MHPLDDPVWNALGSAHAHMSASNARARRYRPEYTRIAALSDASAESYGALAELGSRGETLFHIAQAVALPEPWRLVREGMMAQMVHDGSPMPAARLDGIEVLGERDAAAMVDLAELTRPGPFAQRTHAFGGYVGIREGERLVAMAGQRMAVPGFREVSAVCTHPDHRGRGHARALMLRVMAGIASRGETPFLHVEDHNAAAKQIYERLGFRQRAVFLLRVIEMAG